MIGHICMCVYMNIWACLIYGVYMHKMHDLCECVCACVQHSLGPRLNSSDIDTYSRKSGTEDNSNENLLASQNKKF